ncbi:hypothetical protein K2X96_04125 [Patescibacteria group bacterium]|nr:hypothetical protein [Patescibacteria group bacterium]
MYKERSFNLRVWNGDQATVSEARRAYADDQTDANLLRFASTLYSFRVERNLALELVLHRIELLTYAITNMQDGEKAPPYDNEMAQNADLLSTIFEWMSWHKDTPEHEREDLHNAAVGVCLYGLLRANPMLADGSTSHTWCLLMLTHSQLLITNEDTLHAANKLWEVSQTAAYVRDPNQRSRVYRKLGTLYRQLSGRWIRGVHWHLYACFMRDIPLGVRVKNFAALLGIIR